MGRIIRLLHDRHRDVQALLPWYAMGKLDPAEQAEVAAHLDECPDCKAELAFDRQLTQAIGETPLDVEQSWAAMRRRLEDAQPKLGVGATLRRWLKLDGLAARPMAPSFGWALAAQAGLLLCAGVLLMRSAAPPAGYHTLGAAPADATGNLVVVFRPDVSERTIRTILRANAARMVDGPTSTDAYVLHIPAAGRAAALQRLRKTADVVLAEPIDSANR